MATASRTWKRFEQRVAEFFGARRRPLSGNRSGRDDVIGDDADHPRLFLEAKLRERHAVYRIWDAAAKLAKKADKTPVVCLQEKNRPGFLIVVHCDHIADVAADFLAARDDEDVLEFERDVRMRRGADG